ncbi:MAG: Rne/Rng family ribonuclease [Pseudomonadota bacterium]
MSNKMLIDASHPEETRVAVVRGNRIEEFDFESQEKKQLRGNIYLAKVTRVEPSLQAAFIDYGGNRHGFLAFSEIHPDYYQIPVADRQALIEAEAEEARASMEAEEAEDNLEAQDGEADAEKPKRGGKRRGTRKAKSSKDTSDELDADPDATTDADTEIETPSETQNVIAEDSDEQTSDAPSEAKTKAKPARKTTRRRAKSKKTEDEASEQTSAEETDAADSVEDTKGDADEDPTTIAAVVETDSISEPLPGEEDGESEDDTSQEMVSEDEEAPAAPKKRRKTSRAKKAKTEAQPDEKPAESEEVTSQSEDESASVEEKTSESDSESSDAEEAAKVSKPVRSRRRKKQDTVAEDQAEPQESSSESEEESSETEAVEEDDIESVGQEDALEEAAAPRRIRKQYKIQEVIKRRQILLVQVVKEERGNKGAALTTYLSLAGRYSVLMPNTARGGGISRKITNTSDRKRLKAIASELDVPNGMGVILRTAGASRTKVEITRDFQYLMRLWEQVRNLTLSSTAPCLVYEEGSLVKRSIRDLYDKDTGEILVSGEKGFEEARDFMGMLMPSHVKKVKLYKDAQAIFARYNVESQLDNMVTPQVTLKSGGYLVINQTEALVAVDVNSGRATREHSIENTALQTNLEAAEEVARQLRLRDLAGLIVIDFIDMEERRNNRAVEKRLKECLKSDRARIQVGRISHFGLLEMSRQRIRASVLESTMDVCPHCGGVGYVRSESAIALHVFRALEEHVSRNRKWDARVKTTPDIAAHILNNKRVALVELEQKFGIQIVINGDASLHGQQFEIEKGERAKVSNDYNAIGYDGDAVSDLPDGTEDENGETEGKGRKRNRRRNRKNRTEEPDLAHVESSEDETLEPVMAEDEDGEDKPRKKRRRGKRGGRRRRDSEENLGVEAGLSDDEAHKASVVTASVSEAAENSSDAAGENHTAADDAEEEVVEAKPARRSTRRKKAPVNTSASTDADSVEAGGSEAANGTAETPSLDEAPKPKRRTTRRKASQPVEEATAESTISAETETDAISQPVSQAGAETEDEAEANDKPKKSGWWSRGGGFF